MGPNPMKPANPTDRQYYEGIKVRAQPLLINIQSSSNPKTNTPPIKGQQVRRKSNQSVVVSPAKSPALTVVADNNATDSTPISPASPILKAQLSAPPKQNRESVVTPISSKGDMKSQVISCQTKPVDIFIWFVGSPPFFLYFFNGRRYAPSADYLTLTKTTIF